MTATFFVTSSRRIPVLGIDPAENVVPAARAAGVPTEIGFFGLGLAKPSGRRRDGCRSRGREQRPRTRPDTNDFVAGLARVLGPEGVLSIEFPEAATMLGGAQFDQIYHEHVFYFSLLSCESTPPRNGLPRDRCRSSPDPRGKPSRDRVSRRCRSQ